ncbi:NACHT domain-containing protein [Actinomadura fulvescens]|uniref:NACHT domain-containing protein n=1 Tax=Actinomadura fulvescens TaxID=46160 RepID=A0ABN3QVA3_9ACTN
MVLGKAGAGKTVLALELLIQLLEERRRDPAGPVPVLISAVAVDTRTPFETWLAGHLARRFGLNEADTADLVRRRRILPVLDGLDEMDAEHASERASALVNALNAYMLGRDRAPVVATCRPREYRRLPEALDRATHVELVPMGGHGSAAYLREQLRDEDDLRRCAPVLEALEDDPGGLVAEELATPWRLTLALTVFLNDGDPAALLPGPSADAAAYRNEVNALLLDQYVPAVVRLRDPNGRYPAEKVAS